MQSTAKLKRSTVHESGYEQICFAEVLTPGNPNTYGDLWTLDAIRRAAYMFMENGFQIDVNHDNVDVSDKIKVVESFIARAGDPDFIVGSWVVGVHVLDSDIWQQILDGEINGYSYEAFLSLTPATLTIQDSLNRQGTTEPYPEDGHTHEFWVVVDANNRPVIGGTSMVNGHSHVISTHTVTDIAAGHLHRVNIVEGKGGK